MGNHLFRSSDHLGREWHARAEFDYPPRPSNWVKVLIRCLRGGRHFLCQRAEWHPVHGWDMSRPWYPRAPRPVPEATLAKIEGWLRSLTEQQQQGEVSRG